MKRHLNTLFVTTEGAYLHKDGEAVEVRLNGETKLRVPLLNLDGIVVFGYDSIVSAALLGACAEADVTVSFHTPNGRFLAASRGFTSGNIALRRAQYRAADTPGSSTAIARNIVLAKLANSRAVLQRAARDHATGDDAAGSSLREAAELLGHRIRAVQRAVTVDEIRGYEGEGAAAYFAAFNDMLTVADNSLRLAGRTRQPPLDPVNSLLSFCYNLLMHDCRSACESCGLDPQCGFLHTDRSGRPSLALDLMEEFRAFLADRAAISLLNRRQITADDFETGESGGVYLKDKSRKKLLQHWQERKADEITHPFLDEKTTVGLLPHLQARLLARHLRGDLDAYPAFLIA